MYPQSHQDNSDEIIAHMSPSEVKELIEMQGGMPDQHPSGLPYFKKLEKIFFEPRFNEELQGWARQGFAGGGEVEGINDFIRSKGRYGDTTAVVLPRHIADLFDYTLNNGRPSINPHTGKREYFLGGLLGGLKNIFSKVASTVGSAVSPALNAIGSVAKQALPAVGNLISSAAPELGAAAGSMLSRTPLGSTIGGLAGQALTGLGRTVGSAMQSGQLPSPQDVMNQARLGAVQHALPAMVGVAQNKLGQMSQGSGIPALLAGAAHNYLGNQANQYMSQYD